jgi:maltooligosyltrehalose trehalohydrolase
VHTILQPNTRRQSQGVEVHDDAVHFRTWSPGSERVDAVILDEQGVTLRVIALDEQEHGYFVATDPDLHPGALYKYRLNGNEMWPDPVSRYQPLGVHGPSQVVDPNAFEWTDQQWSRPALPDLIIYELHVGTFTGEGTFRAAIDRLPHLATLGVTAIEVMPVADFPGQRNWGYDGVMIYAPARAYGSPNDFRAFIDAAHAHGLVVILDVVFNHFGPDGNYLGCYTPEYLDRNHETPWGAAFHLGLRPVRDFFVENPVYWMREFHIDGFRLDATHQIYDSSSKHLLTEIADNVHQRGGFVIAEDDRNEPALVTPNRKGGIGLDACWADDFHHVVRVTLTGERDGYFANYSGGPNELCETLEHGWLYRGQAQPASGAPRGADPTGIPPERFVYCISNHDQVGNRAFGERLNHVVPPAAFRAASALLLLAPCTPMIFMGQEWAATTPFQYFTDHNDELGLKITRGRRREFRHFAAFNTPELREKIPDPQADKTFTDSKLNWNDLTATQSKQVLELYRELLRLRKTCLTDRARGDWGVDLLSSGLVAIRYHGSGHLVVADLVGHGKSPELGSEKWQLIFSSNDERFGGSGTVTFAEPTVALYRAE